MNHKNVLIAGGVSIVTAAAGAVGGYFLAVRKTTEKFQQELSEQLAAAERVWMLKHKVGMYASPVTMVQQVEDVVPVEGQTQAQLDAHTALYKTDSWVTDDQDLGRILTSLRKDEPYQPVGSPISGPSVTGRRGSHDDDDHDPMSINHNGSRSMLGLAEELEAATDEVNRNLFQVDDGPEWPNYSDYLEENPRRADEPYVITITEYDTGDAGFEQATVTWYDEDGIEGLGVLADAADIPIDDVDRVVGEANMEKFGMWSGTSSIVYVRNEKIRTDFEVHRHRGSYAVAVGLKLPNRKSKRTPAAARRSADE
jgi:hypothetical protein